VPLDYGTLLDCLQTFGFSSKHSDSPPKPGETFMELLATIHEREMAGPNEWSSMQETGPVRSDELWELSELPVDPPIIPSVQRQKCNRRIQAG
jgi:hypothetical protein